MAESTTPSTEAPPPPANGVPASDGITVQEIMLFGVVLVLWLLVFRSFRKQKGKDKERENELKGVKKGDRVVTVGRMHGTVTAVNDETMTIKPDKHSDCTLTFDKVSLLRVVTPGGKKEGGEKAE